MLNISWEDAKRYVSWLSRETGEPYRLPSESEWEYAARAGTVTLFPWGDELGDGRANCDGCGSRWDDTETAPVGSFRPNGFGLYDMHGNLWELVEDCWNDSYEGAPTDGGPQLSGMCTERVLRGGSWNFEPVDIRSASRGSYSATGRSDFFGFRVARAIAPRVPPEAGRSAVSKAERTQNERLQHVPQPMDTFADELTTGGHGPQMVVMPVGSYRMGCLSDDDACVDDENPVHEVRISRPFALSRYEVTRGEFRRFVEATGQSTGDSCRVYEAGSWETRSGYNWQNPGFRQSNRDPVVCVSWQDAMAYLSWLTQETGNSYRLPSEAEWEFAARGGTETKYHFGDAQSQLCDWGNGADLKAMLRFFRLGVATCWDSFVDTAPVGSFGANQFGLHDLHGNVWEWVEDCWNDSYEGAPGNGSAWASGECGKHVLRGGSWHAYPGMLRSAFRNVAASDHRHSTDGFRVARSLLH